MFVSLPEAVGRPKLQHNALAGGGSKLSVHCCSKMALYAQRPCQCFRTTRAAVGDAQLMEHLWLLRFCYRAEHALVMAFVDVFLPFSASSVPNQGNKFQRGEVVRMSGLGKQGRAWTGAQAVFWAARRRVCAPWLASAASHSPSINAGASSDASSPSSPSKNGVTSSVKTPTLTDRMSQRAQSLRAFLRGHKSLFRPGEGFHTEVALTCTKNDTAQLFVPLEELESYRGRRGFPGADVVAVISQNAGAIVEAGIKAAQVQKELYEGKNLGQLSRLEAIEEQIANDLSDQLRVVSYAVLAQDEDAAPVDFLHKRNVALVLELYQELGVDLGRIDAGWKAMAHAIQELLGDSASYNKRLQPAIDTLLTMLVGDRWLGSSRS
jgi:hypothetical protein